MFGFATKKRVKKELKKIADSFRVRDEEIFKKADQKEVRALRDELNQMKGAISVLLNKSQVQVPISIKKSQGLIETKIINRVRRSKKALVMSEISKLKDNHSVVEMYEEIVLNKGICSKASYYRYIQNLKKSNEIKLRQY